MEEQLISFETAKLAKEKGFRECNISHNYNKEGKLYKPPCISLNINIYEDISYGINGYFPLLAPTQSLLQKWLREVHNMYIVVMPSYTDRRQIKDKFFFEIHIKNKVNQSDTYHGTYEDALEAALKRSLNLIIL